MNQQEKQQPTDDKAARRRAANRKYYLAHIDRFRYYYLQNREARRIKDRAYREANPEKVKARHKKYNATKRKKQ